MRTALSTMIGVARGRRRVLAARPRRSSSRTAGVVRMQTLNVRDILYVLTGGGGNALALMRDDGVVLIDTKGAGWGRPILEAIQAVTDKPVTTIMNTHAHDGSRRGERRIRERVTKIIAHANAKAAMQKMAAFAGAERQVPAQHSWCRIGCRCSRAPIGSTCTTSGAATRTATWWWCSRRSGSRTSATCFRGRRRRSSTPRTAAARVEFPRTLAAIVAGIKAWRA